MSDNKIKKQLKNHWKILNQKIKKAKERLNNKS